MARYLKYSDYDNHALKTLDLTQDEFNAVIDDAEAAVDDLTFQRLKDEYFYNHLSDFRKEQLIKALVKTVEWWHERKDLLNDFGTFNSLSIGEFDVSVPRAFEDNPRAFWESMNVPTIAKRYLERAGLCYAGKIA